jgi:hypothetical protein
VHPRLNASSVRRILQATADPAAKCANPEDPTTDGCGAGLLNIKNTITMAANGDVPGDPRSGNIVHGGFGCAVGGDVRGDGARGDGAGGSSTAASLLLGAALLLVARAIKRA